MITINKGWTFCFKALDFVKLNKIWIVITPLWSILHQTELFLVPNQSGKCNFNLFQLGVNVWLSLDWLREKVDSTRCPSDIGSLCNDALYVNFYVDFCFDLYNYLFIFIHIFCNYTLVSLFTLENEVKTSVVVTFMMQIAEWNPDFIRHLHPDGIGPWERECFWIFVIIGT